MNYSSPRTPGSTPIHEWEYSRMSSATPTPSPRTTWFDSATPRRPATRAAHHSRSSSYAQQHGSFTPRAHMESPRYNSYGDYCTVDVSAKDFSSSRRPSGPFPPYPARDRRHSYAHVRASTPYGQSDEDEIIEVDRHNIFFLPGQSRSKGRRYAHGPVDDGVWHANHGDYLQSAAHYADPAYARTAHHSHARRASASVPQRSATTKPTNANRPKPPSPAKATDADARRHKIPTGYSLKNWDPSEEPILLLGSVFDANSLGKWIYDWTVYHEGATTPIADMAGELWLLLIQLSVHTKEAEDKVGQVRSAENREIVDEFIDAGERLMDKLRTLLKACEAPMLKAARKKQSSLGKNSGVEFVETLFGRDRELAKTEKFMQSVRLFNLRFDANCSDILSKPTA
ncbi:vegetative cell wall protein gp1 [Hirsutella rhossiliensis]|uniref:Vegetative cell wall protein gp1 n=1 Tax=Hirsutella rhossiliensis TaxID=111463 RepID=A0A9P8MUB9_9HYPO|nr:vegetative cell wall protein gp1 [Hirsutella rhossiliensis]KAH0961532.1 vegetative cell wall protein gp1 [Hirsutella rhossiliensis]